MRVDVDHYLVLGVPRTADGAVIRAAYVALAKRYHPDVAAGDGELAASNFRLITEAYAVLSDPERRAQYDAIARQAELVLAAGGAARTSAIHLNRRSYAGIAIVAAVFLLAGGFLVARNMLAPKFEAQAAAIADEASQADEARARQEEEARAAVLRGQASQPGGSRQVILGPVGAGAGVNVSRGKRLEMPTGQAHCLSDDGIKFSITNRNGEPTVTYNGDPAVRASVQYAGKHLLLLTNIVPNDSVIIGVLRGEEAGALVFHADEKGNPTRTVPAKCVGLAY